MTADFLAGILTGAGACLIYTVWRCRQGTPGNGCEFCEQQKSEAGKSCCAVICLHCRTIWYRGNASVARWL